MIRYRIAALAGPGVAGAVIPFDVRYEFEAAGIQTTTTSFAVDRVETFDARAAGTGSFTTDFGTSGAITGAYSNVQVNNNDQYGGAGGTGRYAVTFANVAYSLDLSSTITGGINYFGYWLSALDRGNRVTFYCDGAVLFTFNPTDVLGSSMPAPTAVRTTAIRTRRTGARIAASLTSSSIFSATGAALIGLSSPRRPPAAATNPTTTPLAIF